MYHIKIWHARVSFKIIENIQYRNIWHHFMSMQQLGMIKRTRQDYFFMWKFSKYCNGTNVYKRSGNSFQCKAFHELLQRSSLIFHKLLFNLLWDSWLLRTSWIYVISLSWISKPLSTLLVLRIPTLLLVVLIWRILPDFRYSNAIASITPKQSMKFLERRRFYKCW